MTALRPASSSGLQQPSSVSRTQEHPKVPTLVKNFFQHLSSFEPAIVEGARKETTYSVERLGVAFATNKHKGGIVLLDSNVSPALLYKVKEASARLLQVSQKNEQSGSEEYFRSFSYATKRSKKPAKDDLRLIQAEAEILSDAPSSHFRHVYDQQNRRVMRMFWVATKEPSSLPSGATHNVGATAILVDRTAQSVLLVVPKTRNKWNFPGGNFDPIQDKSDRSTALRELAEETGNSVQGLLSLMGPGQKLESMLAGRTDFPDNPLCSALNFPWVFDEPKIAEKMALNPPQKEIVKAAFIPFAKIFQSIAAAKELQQKEDVRAKVIGEKAKSIKPGVDGVPLGETVIPLLKAALSGHGFSKTVDKGWMVNYSASIPKG